VLVLLDLNCRPGAVPDRPSYLAPAVTNTEVECPAASRAAATTGSARGSAAEILDARRRGGETPGRRSAPPG
jgi:hypothetical protein